MKLDQPAMPGLQMKYFVLKPSGNDAYALASRVAMRAYALSIKNKDSKLAEDIYLWAERESDDAIKNEDSK